MLRIAAPPPPAWDALLPAQARRLPAELARIDAYLDDERFITPWRGCLTSGWGRPSVPIDTLLRLLYLKHRSGLGYESLCREVADSISWRRFCHIGLDQPVPHPTTLVKLVGRAGSQPINQLNHALLAKLSADKLLRARKPDPAAGAHDAGYLGITLERLGRERRFLLGRDGVEFS